ncbi:MAG TPA: YqaA family protein [Bacteroidales bacterium]|jgi:membrane protein YqaA with SNARE-associated domain|nr:YqaA family protein [Bacteroidales bacterium]
MTFWFGFGYWGLFFVSFLSATIIPFSSDAFVATMVALKFNAGWVFIIASIGNTLGGMTNYYIGKAGKTEWINKYLRISDNKIQKAQKYVQKYTVLSALFTWLPGIGDALALVLGLFKANVYKVLLFMLIGKAARYFVIIFLAQLFI